MVNTSFISNKDGKYIIFYLLGENQWRIHSYKLSRQNIYNTWSIYLVMEYNIWFSMQRGIKKTLESYFGPAIILETVNQNMQELTNIFMLIYKYWICSTSVCIVKNTLLLSEFIHLGLKSTYTVQIQIEGDCLFDGV
jgi:hypothetical protein